MTKGRKEGYASAHFSDNPSLRLLYELRSNYMLCTQVQVASWLAVEVVFLAGLVLATLLGFHTHAKRTLFVGIFCDVFNVMMYASPLAIMVNLN